MRPRAIFPPLSSTPVVQITLLALLVAIVLVRPVAAEKSGLMSSTHPVVASFPDSPASRSSISSRGDTLWYGGDDGTGVAYEGGVWDWETITGDTLQGWTSVGNVDDWNVYVGWVCEDSFLVHGDPQHSIINGSDGMLWCGIHEDQADCAGYYTGMGYGNSWCQTAQSPHLTYTPMSSPLVEFSYFVDTEVDYDYVYVYLLCFDISNELIDEEEVSRRDGWGFTPQDPIFFSQQVHFTAIPVLTYEIACEIRFVSDHLWSDEDGERDSELGAFGLDDFYLSSGLMAPPIECDFETGPDGWTFGICPEWGTEKFGYLVGDSLWTSWIPPECGFSGYAYGVFHPTLPFDPIAHRTHVRTLSGPVPHSSLLPPQWSQPVVRGHLATGDGAGYIDYRFGMTYFPHYFDGCAVPQWSRVLWDPLYTPLTPDCTEFLWTPEQVPTEWDSVRFAVECEVRSTPGPLSFHGSPPFDNVQVGQFDSQPSGIEDRDEPQGTNALVDRLEPVRPNPLNESARIGFRLAAEQPATLVIVDSAGRRVRTLHRGRLPAGEHSLVWDGQDDQGNPAGAGAFWARLELGNGRSLSRRVIRLR